MVAQAKHIVIGTAGHIDHGKTSLLRALTGIDADRLPEEKRRGITIDLGFAFLETKSPSGSPLSLSFVDVPGHSLFIHNMLAGAGGVAAVLLVVSAEEGVKPQTVEHLAICGLLGIGRGLVAITKVDAVEPGRVLKVRQEIETLLGGTPLGEGIRMFAVSALTGENIAALRQALLEIAETMPDGDQDHVLRLPIDRAFVMKGFGTVVTGTLLSGRLSAGQSLSLQPGEQMVRVRGMQTHGRAQQEVAGGSRVALNLTGVEVSAVSRGQMLVAPQTLEAVSLVDVEAWLLPGVGSVKHGARLHLHAFAASTVANVLLYGKGRWEPEEKRLLRLKLQTPTVLTAGDPFVLRSPGATFDSTFGVPFGSTIGGGRVLDANSLGRQRKAQAMQGLVELQAAAPAERLVLRIARRGVDGLTWHRLTAETGLLRMAAARLLAPAIAAGRLLEIDAEGLLDRASLAQARERILLAMQAHSGQMKRSELRSRTSLAPATLEFLLHKLASEGSLRLSGEMVAAGIPAALDPMLAPVEAIYLEAGLAAPLLSEVAVRVKCKESDLRPVITQLLRAKVLVVMGSEKLFIHEDVLARLRDEIRRLAGQTVDVARFKNITGLSRKYAIPLLEYLDRQRITRKQGDERVVL